MGFFRLLLAVAVLCNHSAPIANLHWIKGPTAVEIFFVVSGFYMQLVLTTKYTRASLGPSWWHKFYAARYARLYPAYLAGVCLILLLSGIRLALHHYTLPLSVLGAIFALPRSLANLSLQVFLVFTNATMLFQDLAMFVTVHDGTAALSARFRQTDVLVYSALAVPQAWSLGVELTFYLVAPMLLGARSRWLALVAVTAFTTKVLTLVRLPVDAWDPYSYRFSPFELTYFCLGALAYRYRALLAAPGRRLPDARLLAPIAYLLACALAVGNYQELFTFFAFPIVTAIALPFMFDATLPFTLDRAVGELSYPFYIFHQVVYDNIVAAVKVAGLAPLGVQKAAWFTAAATIAVSWAVVRAEVRWLEPYRARFARPAAGALDAHSLYAAK